LIVATPEPMIAVRITRRAGSTSAGWKKSYPDKPTISPARSPNNALQAGEAYVTSPEQPVAKR